MENDINTPVRPKRKTKSKIIFVLFLVVLAAAGYVYYWLAGVQKLQREAAGVMDENAALRGQAEQLAEVKNLISAEYDRCEEFISQSTGDFGSFEHCKKFIHWVNANSSLR